jgi:hypothetical protein
MSNWAHVRDTKRKARKSHGCLICGEDIEPGEVYIERFGFRGEPVHMRMHPECESFTHDWTDMDWESFSTGDVSRDEIRATASTAARSSGLD